MIIILVILLAFALSGLISAWAVKYRIDPGIKGWR